jgi:hypothetical protein
MICAKAFTQLALLATLMTIAGVWPVVSWAQTQGLSSLGPVTNMLGCAALGSIDLSKAVGASTKILSAVSQSTIHGRVCVVKGNIAPNIQFEARLPVKGWTQRYLQTGCGGLCGELSINVDHAEECQPYQDGQLATASTDMGHEGGLGDASFGADPQQRIDFAYRGVHLTAVAVKALIAKFYGRPAKYAYFSGCSDGGREALMEAQRFPKDFDGIAAGAPAMNFQVQNSFYHAWMARSNTDAHGHAILTADKLPVLHAAVLAQCDALDGLKDGQITNPRQCHFDPSLTQCAANVTDTKDCLSAAQVATTKKFYAGPHDAQGHRFVVGSVQPGSELQWRGVFVPATVDGKIFSADIALQSLKNVIFKTNPPANMQLKNFAFDQATFNKVKQLHGLNDATNPDVHAFVDHGGKLLLWHGWADPHISPLNTIAYYNAVQKTLGKGSEQSVRLFLFPGMGHCGGGEGPNQFDILTPLMAWVEGQHAPQEVIAGRPDEVVGPQSMPPRPSKGMQPPQRLDSMQAQPVNRTRPIYPYPQVAKYSGHGSVDDAANFTAATPANAPAATPPWMGSDFYQGGFQQQCSSVENKLVCR